MPRIATPLSDSKCEAAKARDKDYSLFDGEGLHLYIKPNGSKTWRFKYKRPDGRKGLSTFGKYPALSLKAAREKRLAALTMLANGIDPMEAAKEEKLTSEASSKHSFEALAREWHARNGGKRPWSPEHATTVMARMETYLFPKLGKFHISKLTTKSLYAPIDDAESKGFYETGDRLRQYLTGIMRHAIRRGIIENNPAADLEGSGSSAGNHRPALPFERLPELLHRISQYQGRRLTRLATEICLHVFVRSSELRFARWGEIDFENAMWVIPETRTPLEDVKYSHRGSKMRAAHLIPLSSQAIRLLKELHSLSGDSGLLFPSDKDNGKTMSENTINSALRRMGYNTKKELCGHGVRAMACSALTESELWKKDAVDLQMSHMERDNSRAPYIHLAKHLQVRRLMLQWWSDYLDANLKQYISPFDYAHINNGKPVRAQKEIKPPAMSAHG